MTFYGSYGSEADPQIDGLLRELESLDPAAAARWTRIMDLWRSVQTELVITQDVLPDGLPETDELCLVVLGFQLNPDGSMREELVERLRVARETMTYCVFPGSFDPPTNGHIDLIRRAAGMFDRVTVTVMVNIAKAGAIPCEERVRMLEKACAELPNVKVDLCSRIRSAG